MVLTTKNRNKHMINTTQGKLIRNMTKTRKENLEWVSGGLNGTII